MHTNNEIEIPETTIGQALYDQFGRKHSYLRISLTEKCNLRCKYCMPAEGVQLSPRNDLMSANEIHAISRMFVSLGVNKIRLTGGEPLLRKDFDLIFKNLNQLSAEIGLTTNGILVHKHIDLFKQVNLQNINLSIDTLNSRKFHEITRRNQFGQVMDNMHLLLNLGINPRLNVVLLKGFNDNEVVDFIQTTKDLDLTIRFIEFMPFEGNKWDKSKLVSLTEILERTATYFGAENIVRLNDKPNDTSKNFKIKGHKGSFSIISTVTHPFCDSCNRIRLTANGKLKNCLFSGSETDLLTQLRNGSNIETLIRQAILNKKAVRGGMRSLEEFSDPKLNQHNRSMILIGG